MLLTSGRPFTVYSGINTVSNVVQSTADCNGCSRTSGQLVIESGKNFWFDSTTRAQFSAPAPGSIGNTGRNFFLAPHYFQWDSSLSKKFKISERYSFDLRFDARNVLNNPSFDNPTAVINSSIFGRINDSVTNNARRIQVSEAIQFLKFCRRSLIECLLFMRRQRFPSKPKGPDYDSQRADGAFLP